MKRLCTLHCVNTIEASDVVPILHFLIQKTISLFFENGKMPDDADDYIYQQMAPAFCKNIIKEDRDLNPNHPEFYRSSEIVELLLEKGDTLLYPTDLEAFKVIANKTAILIAILSFQPNGILFWGIHYENSF